MFLVVLTAMMLCLVDVLGDSVSKFKSVLHFPVACSLVTVFLVRSVATWRRTAYCLWTAGASQYPVAQRLHRRESQERILNTSTWIFEFQFFFSEIGLLISELMSWILQKLNYNLYVTIYPKKFVAFISK